MMKLLLSLLFVAAARAAELIELTDVRADSVMGQHILSHARYLGNNNNNNNNNKNGNNNKNNNPYANIDFTWLAGYSIKFQGCTSISQWNEAAEGENDVRIATKRLVRFRLCPTDYCSGESSKGCNSGYGDYIIDMDTYLYAYFQAKATYQAFKCDYLTNNVCSCSNDNENYSQDMCLWDCYSQHNMAGVCMQNNPYQNYNNGNNNGGYQNKYFAVENYLQCAQAYLNNGNRELANNNYANYNWDGNYYFGPYCASQGGAIYLGMFTDDSCTSFADDNGGRTTYSKLTGKSLPYGNSNIVDMDCVSCKEPSNNNNGGNDNEDADSVAEVCEQIWFQAGKCEANLPYGTVYEPNNNACNYMEGIKIVRKDGTVVTTAAKANKTASVFIGIFVVAFVLLSAYVYYLKTKLDRASINLSD